MGVKFFGQYLLEKKTITPQQLIEAVEYQESKNLKFGEYALSKGYLKRTDIIRIQNEQKRVDMQFGEVAVKLNILTPTQVLEILTMQKNDHVYIGDALVIKGFITKGVLERELALFKEDQSKYAAGEIHVPEGVSNPDIVKDVVNLTQKMLQRIAYLNIKVGEGFISTNEPEENYILVSVALHGTLNYIYGFSSSQEVARLIASSIIGEEVKDDTKDIISDGVKEFCNITCGNIIAKLSQRGKNVDISPPTEIVFENDGYHLVEGKKAVHYRLASPVGGSYLILVEG